MVQYTKTNKTIKLESSDAYRAFTTSLNKDTEKKWMLKRLLILETQEKDAEATMFTLLLVPVVLPTYMASAFGLDKGVL
jgi:hypothetical protein